MANFSERYGYTKASDIIIREYITPEIHNAICTCFDRLPEIFRYATEQIRVRSNRYHYVYLEEEIWASFLNERLSNFDYKYSVVATEFIEDPLVILYKKLDLLEFVISYLHDMDDTYEKSHYVSLAFVKMLNYEFDRLNFAYRIIGEEIVEISSKEEIEAIENAIENSPANIQLHLNRALEMYSQRPDGDYRNSIKESISAVEVLCRSLTNQNTLGDALNQLEKKGVVIPKMLKDAFVKLYAYTNQKESGIRHALMDEEGIYLPSKDEALFMLVSCSAFINYLRSKMSD